MNDAFADRLVESARRLGEDVPHPRSYGNNARVLGRYVRELKLLSLPEAIRRMTSLPAQTFQLEGRGEIKTGEIGRAHV